MKMGRRGHRILHAIHKYAGLTACLWLLVLGVTGVLLDHHEWRWLNQNSVPASWTSAQIGRLVPGTVMRHIVVEQGAIFGASERGAWLSRNGGGNWRPVRFDGIAGQPQVHGVVDLGGSGFAGAHLATDDGVWRLSAEGAAATRFAMAGERVTAISAGHDPGSLVAVLDKSRLVRVGLADGRTEAIAIASAVVGLSETVPLNRFVMELHFGRGLLPGQWSIWLNDLGGVALGVLALSGFGYWWIRRPGRRKGLSMKAQRGAIRWLFRAHGPVVGLIAALPILLLSLTAIPLNHIYGFIAWAKPHALSRSALPPAYKAVSLDHEIDGVAAWPGQAGRLSIATRFGVLESRDNGRSWRTDLSLPVPIGAPGANVFRVEDRVFAGFGGGDNFVRGRAGGWSRLDGPTTAITSASLTQDGEWWIKNSKAIYREKGQAFAESGVDFKQAAVGTPLFLFLADVHAGVIFHEQFKWLNDLFAVLAVLLALSGPIIWLRRKWI